MDATPLSSSRFASLAAPSLAASADLAQGQVAAVFSASCSSSSTTSTMGRMPARTRSGGEQPVAFKSQAWSNWAPSEYRISGTTNNGKSAALEQPMSPTLPAICDSPELPPSPAAFDATASSSEDEDAMDDDDCYTSSGSSLGEETEASSCSSSSEDLPSDCLPSSPASSALPPSQWRHESKPFTFPGPTSTDSLSKDDLESCLRFASPGCSLSDPSSSAPPAFFPLQRVSFAPQLKIKTPGGVPLAIGAAAKSSGRDGIAGMMLGVTGVIEVIDAEKTRKTGKEVLKTQRMIADFATDLTNGLRIWRRDAAPIVREKLRVEREYRARKQYSTEGLDDPNWEEMLAPGTFMLPLSMKIPCSEKLPPSFESAHYRIRYTMSLAVFSSRMARDGRPEILHVHSVPFHILPSTLPTPAPHIPMLTHDARKGGFLAGLSRALSLTAPSPGVNGTPGSDKTCTHIVSPSIPTTSYSPGSVIPITLRIADCPTEPTDLYIRLSLIRKIYVRDSAYEMMNEWGLPEEMFFEEFCKEQEEIVSRWGYVPYSVRAQEGATPGSKAQVIISDITLPVGGPNGEWTHGYSSELDVGPTPCPSMKHGECSWFSPALSQRVPAKADYDRYVHASARHYISIEVGFANDKMKETLAEIGDCVPEMEIPQPNTFTFPRSPATSPLSGLSTVNPFPVASSSSSRTKRSVISPFQHAPQLPAFPGKFKEILIPVTIGSVAEPQMSCIINRAAEGAAPASVIPTPAARPTVSHTAEQSAERAARDLDESEVERYERVGDDGEEAWLCPPPSYTAAVSSVPAYV